MFFSYFGIEHNAMSVWGIGNVGSLLLYNFLVSGLYFQCSYLYCNRILLYADSRSKRVAFDNGLVILKFIKFSRFIQFNSFFFTLMCGKDVTTCICRFFRYFTHVPTRCQHIVYQNVIVLSQHRAITVIILILKHDISEMINHGGIRKRLYEARE